MESWDESQVDGFEDISRAAQQVIDDVLAPKRGWLNMEVPPEYFQHVHGAQGVSVQAGALIRQFYTRLEDDVRAFQAKYRIPMPDDASRQPSEDYLAFHADFMQEELDEYCKAVAAGDVGGQFDALIDLVYVAIGTALTQGFPFQEGWDLVHEANMKKVRGEDVGRQGRHKLDVVKPEGWTPPDLRPLLSKPKGQLELFPPAPTPDEVPLP